MLHFFNFLNSQGVLPCHGCLNVAGQQALKNTKILSRTLNCANANFRTERGSVCGMFKKKLVSVTKQRTAQSSTDNSYPVSMHCRVRRQAELEIRHIILLVNWDST